MKPLVKFTRPILPLIKQDFDAAMQKIAKKYGVTCDLSGGGWSDTTFSLKVKLEIDNPDAALKQHYTREGKVDVPKNGTIFTMHGKAFKVIGYMENRPKFPMLGEELGTGKKYKFTMEVVLNNTTVKV